jgi:hypothetical protein
LFCERSSMELESARLKRIWEEEKQKLKDLKGSSVRFLSTKTGREAQREWEERMGREKAIPAQELLVEAYEEAYKESLKAEVTKGKVEIAIPGTGVKHRPEKEGRERGAIVAEFKRGVVALKVTTSNDMKKRPALLEWMKDHGCPMSPDMLRVYVKRYVPPPK